MHARNIVLLTTCQLISATGSIVVVTLGGIIGASLSGNPALATLPISIMVVSVAATTIPATMLMRAIGRRRSFSLASVSAAAAVLLAIHALEVASFEWFTVAAALFGVNMAFTQQYRYAAAESVAPGYAARAISLVLVGSIGGAIIGPELVTLGQNAADGVRYIGPLAAVGALYVVQAALFFMLEPLEKEQEERHDALQRPLREIVQQPVFIVAVVGGTIAYGVMTLIMTATPLSMHINDGYSIEQTADVIRNHVLGMYVPSLFAALVIERLGISRMMALGAAVLLIACLVGLRGHTMMHYTAALVLLGIGWNFLYIGGTTMLTLTYSMSERFKAQAVNEFSVFGTSAAASLLAGTIIHMYGWHTLVLLPVPLLLVIVVALYSVRRDSRLSRVSHAHG